MNHVQFRNGSSNSPVKVKQVHGTTSNGHSAEIPHSNGLSNGKASTNIDALLRSVAPELRLSEENGFGVQRIEFVPAKHPDLHMEKLKQKYKPINRETQTPNKQIPQSSSPAAKAVHDENSGPSPPKFLICPAEVIEKILHWTSVRRIGAGLNNLGNTCFLNAVLQCLTYTPPLANYCLLRQHSKSCKMPGFCMFCELERHINNALSNQQQQYKTITPKSIVGNLPCIAKHLRFTRQEDSHEFLRYVIEGMQKACLYGLGKVDPRTSETSIVHRIFGGYTQSQVKCGQCKYESNTFEPFLDLSLEIKRCDTVLKALSNFTSAEILDKANKYKCPSCKRAVQAAKRFSIFSCPNVLTIHLKRFAFSGFQGSKINNPVSFPEKLSLKPYVSRVNENESYTYTLYAVLVHQGHGAKSGHYYSFVKSASNVWHCMNDSSVSQVSAQQVLAQKAYMLFYVKDTASTYTPSTTPSKPLAPQTPEAKKRPLDDGTPNGRADNGAPSLSPSQPNPKKLKQQHVQQQNGANGTPSGAPHQLNGTPAKPVNGVSHLNGTPMKTPMNGTHNADKSTPVMKTPMNGTHNGDKSTPAKGVVSENKMNGTPKHVPRMITENGDEDLGEKVAARTPQDGTKKRKVQALASNNTPTTPSSVASTNGHVNGTLHPNTSNGTKTKQSTSLTPKPVSTVATVVTDDNGSSSPIQKKQKTVTATLPTEVISSTTPLSAPPQPVNVTKPTTIGTPQNGNSQKDNQNPNSANKVKRASVKQVDSESESDADSDSPPHHSPNGTRTPLQPTNGRKSSYTAPKVEVVVYGEETKQAPPNPALVVNNKNAKHQVQVLQELTGFSKATQYSTKVTGWDEEDGNVVDEAAEKTRKKILAEIEKSLDPSKHRDVWDTEYDKGHVKKIKKKNVEEPGKPNPFQEFQATGEKKLLEYGKHNKQRKQMKFQTRNDRKFGRKTFFGNNKKVNRSRFSAAPAN